VFQKRGGFQNKRELETDNAGMASKMHEVKTTKVVGKVVLIPTLLIPTTPSPSAFGGSIRDPLLQEGGRTGGDEHTSRTRSEYVTERADAHRQRLLLMMSIFTIDL
jgi:hypothetical protein